MELWNLRNCSVSIVKELSFSVIHVYWLIVNFKGKIRITKNDTKLFTPNQIPTLALLYASTQCTSNMCAIKTIQEEK